MFVDVRLSIVTVGVIVYINSATCISVDVDVGVTVTVDVLVGVAVTVIVDEEPVRAGIDPRNILIEREREDNMKDVEGR